MRPEEEVDVAVTSDREVGPILPVAAVEVEGERAGDRPVGIVGKIKNKLIAAAQRCLDLKVELEEPEFTPVLRLDLAERMTLVRPVGTSRDDEILLHEHLRSRATAAAKRTWLAAETKGRDVGPFDAEQQPDQLVVIATFSKAVDSSGGIHAPNLRLESGGYVQIPYLAR